MAQRSYLMIAGDDGHVAVLESARQLPLLWLALLDAAAADAEWSAGASLRLAEGAAVGITLEREAALRRLAARRAGVAAWVGEAAGTVLDQFAEFLGAQPGSALRLDVSEWVELFASREQALQVVRAQVAALDGKVSKRRPAPVKKLLEELGLGGLAGQEPAFGALLAGVACRGREAWRRDPPRERRAAEDFVSWSRNSDRHFVAANGRVVAATVTNPNSVETPVIWAPGSSEIVTYASEVPDEVGYLHPQRLSGDGASLFCGSRWHPGAVPRALRLGPDGLRVLHEGEPSFAVSACSVAGDVAGGALYPAAPPARPRAAVWRDAGDVQALADVAADSIVTCMSRDGQLLGVETRLTDAAGNYCGMQAWAWSEDAARSRQVAAGWRAEWVALSSDGRRGVVAVQAEKSGDARLHHWQEGAGAAPVEVGAATRQDAAFSADLGCALLRTADALLLWRPGGTVERVMESAGLVLEPRRVANAGDWWVAIERNPANYATAAVLLWQRGRGLQRFAAPPSESRLGLGLFVASAGDALEELLLFGQWRDSGEPVTWSPARGFVSWGDAPRPVPAPPLDFTPLAQAEDFVYATMPPRNRPMREMVQDFRAAFPSLRPMLYFTASWCEPCRSVEPLLRRPVLQRQLRGWMLLRVDVDDVGIGSRSIGFQASAVPSFVALDDTNCACGEALTGAAWDEDTEENVAAALSAWLRVLSHGAPLPGSRSAP